MAAAQAQAKAKAEESAASDTRSYTGVQNYNSGQIREVIQNLEFLSHRPRGEAQKIIDSDPAHKESRMNKIHSLVEMVNDNIMNGTNITAEAMLGNPKMLSFKLMKLDLQ